ncbi:MAG: DUF3618 domain-containing protein [Arthrobacter sp.]
MSENPDAIRADIEATRARLGTNVDAVADKVTPSNVVHRQTDKVKEAVSGAKEKILGAADGATGKVGATMDDAGAAVGDAPHKVAAKAQGNPLAAGLIAFGAGLLVSSLIPPSPKERESAEALKRAAEPVTTQLADAAKDVAQGLQEPAQEGLENVKATAADAVENVKREGQYAAADVKDTAADAKDRVQNS